MQSSAVPQGQQEAKDYGYASSDDELPDAFFASLSNERLETLFGNTQDDDEDDEEADDAANNDHHHIPSSSQNPLTGNDADHPMDIDSSGESPTNSQVFDPPSASSSQNTSFNSSPLNGHLAFPVRKKYTLRRNIERNAFRGTGFIDHDRTGLYDPEDDDDLEMREADEDEERQEKNRRERERRRRTREGKRKADGIMEARMSGGEDIVMGNASSSSNEEGAASSPMKEHRKVSFDLSKEKVDSSDESDADDDADEVDRDNLLGDIHMSDEIDSDEEMTNDDKIPLSDEPASQSTPTTPHRSKRKAAEITKEKIVGQDAATSEEDSDDQPITPSTPRRPAKRARTAAPRTPASRRKSGPITPPATGRTPSRRAAPRPAVSKVPSRRQPARASTRAATSKAASDAVKAAKAKKRTPMIKECKFCYENKLECTILYEPEQYPCNQCREFNTCCALEDPRTKRQKDGSKLAFKKFAEIERKKKRAAQLKARNELREQQMALTNMKRAMQRAKTCKTCRIEGRKCSWAKKSADGMSDCKFCVKAHRICEAWIDPNLEKALKAKEAMDRNKGILPEKKKRAPRRKQPVRPEAVVPEIPNADHPIPPGYARKQITTSFVHPMVFNTATVAGGAAEELAEVGEDCEFHRTAFQIFGHGVVHPHVTYPLEETISGTHQAVCHEIPNTGGLADTGKTFTTLCKLCTFSRQKILFCDCHDIRAIEGLPKPRAYDFERAYASLMSDMDSRGVADSAALIENVPGGWCSICPSPAFFECCTTVGTAIAIKGTKRDGCGLKLCDVCASNMLRVENQDGSGQDACKVLLKDALKRNILKAQYIHSEALIPDGVMDQLTANRVSIQATVSLDELVKIATAEVLASRKTPGGNVRYTDGLRADVGLITTGKDGYLWEWMQGMAMVARDQIYNGTCI